ncbi:probable E3 ubiquitin ligase complex SCF subunit sconB [Chenopodium quinoa]|uniref:F-box domain-containing protein n=1 Tax=Chenopodium quinoa TaxID=63459 RepID=A0A803ML24_CHEQI|nr:probable E3 ubiquitin ligase complex SCF subunit sconB [Chenopodium quinoa]
MSEISSSKNDMNSSSSTSITDLDVDSLVHCTNYLSIQDISNMAITCKFFRTATDSDSIWHRLFREKWPKHTFSLNSQGSTTREAYLSRRAAVGKFSFVDPLVADFYTDSRPFSHVLLGKNDIIFSQGSLVRLLKIDDFVNGKECLVTLSDHNARITCMRLFPISEASFIRSEAQNNETVLITSSSDRTIRLWWKGSCFRCFRGHNGPVSALSDKLLGDKGRKVLASGGEDGTVRLWSLSSSGKRGQHALNVTLHGHEKPIILLSVAGHKPSLLVSVATDSKIRVWDSTLASASRTSSCVGMTSVLGTPVGIKCFESMVYVAAGNSVQAIDLRTMKKAFTAAVCQPEFYSFEMLPSRSLICTGGKNKALLWDVRKSQDGLNSRPVVEMEGHNGPVTHVYVDPYKIVTGGPDDFFTNIWDVDTGALTNTLICSPSELSCSRIGCNSMAADGCRIVTACSGENGLLRFRDFSNASSSVSSYKDAVSSRFWNSNSYSDSDSDM